MSVTIKITGLAGVYSDPGHVLAYPGGEGVYQQHRADDHGNIEPQGDRQQGRHDQMDRQGDEADDQAHPERAGHPPAAESPKTGIGNPRPEQTQKPAALQGAWRRANAL